MAKIEKSVELVKDIKDFISNSKKEVIVNADVSVPYYKMFDYDDDDIVFVKKEVIEKYIKFTQIEKVDEEFISKNLFKEKEYEELPTRISFAHKKAFYIDRFITMEMIPGTNETNINKEVSYKKCSIVISKKPTTLEKLIPGRWYLCVYNNNDLYKEKYNISRYVLYEGNGEFSYVVSFGQAVKFSERINVDFFNFHLIYDREEVNEK